MLNYFHFPALSMAANGQIHTSSVLFVDGLGGSFPAGVASIASVGDVLDCNDAVVPSIVQYFAKPFRLQFGEARVVGGRHLARNIRLLFTFKPAGQWVQKLIVENR